MGVFIHRFQMNNHAEPQRFRKSFHDMRTWNTAPAVVQVIGNELRAGVHQAGQFRPTYSKEVHPVLDLLFPIVFDHRVHPSIIRNAASSASLKGATMKRWLTWCLSWIWRDAAPAVVPAVESDFPDLQVVAAHICPGRCVRLRFQSGAEWKAEFANPDQLLAVQWLRFSDQVTKPEFLQGLRNHLEGKP